MTDSSDSGFIRGIQEMFAFFDEALSEHGQRRRFSQEIDACSASDLQTVSRTLRREWKDQAAFEQALEDLEDPVAVAKGFFELEDFIVATDDPFALDLCLFLLAIPAVQEWLASPDSHLLTTNWDLAKNPNLTADQIRRLADTTPILVPDRVALDAEPCVYLAALPNTPGDVLQRLLQVDETSVRRAVSKHPNLAFEEQLQLAASKRKQERIFAARARSTDERILLFLTKDKSPEVRAAVYSRTGDVPPNLLLSAYFNRSRPSAAFVKKLFKQFKELRKLAIPPHLGRSVKELEGSLDPIAFARLKDGFLAAEKAAISDVRRRLKEKAGTKPKRRSLAELRSWYDSDPEAWEEIARQPGFNARLLRTFLLDGRDLNRIEAYQKAYKRNVCYVETLLPKDEALYDVAAKNPHSLVLIACLLRLEEDDELDERLLNCLRFNPALNQQSLAQMVEEHDAVWPFIAQDPKRVEQLFELLPRGTDPT